MFLAAEVPLKLTVSLGQGFSWRQEDNMVVEVGAHRFQLLLGFPGLLSSHKSHPSQ